MMPITKEIKFKSARSGGKGGQNVNKVETMVEGYWNISASTLFTEDEKIRLIKKLEKKINSTGELLIKSQVFRSQLENKNEVIRKFDALITSALKEPKKRKPTAPSKASKIKRLDSKNKSSLKKEDRKKIVL